MKFDHITLKAGGQWKIVVVLTVDR